MQRGYALVVVAALAACGPEGAGPDEPDGGVDVDCDPFAVDVVSFSPGRNAGFGADKMPGVVLGPPQGSGNGDGSTDVVSLGVGGVIVLELGCAVVDGEGVDLVVYENAFWIKNPGADDFSDDAFVDPAEVAVSGDGEVFTAFACVPPGINEAPDDGVDGCAGMATVTATASNGLAGVFPGGGGDGFDLETIGVAEARFVRITDRARGGAGTSAGFDLDAVAGVVRR